MRHWVTYPLITHPAHPDFVTKAGLTRFVQTAEAAGFDGIGFTDHPAPSHKWLEAGGHDALDPFAALAFAAAVSERILLIPNILVLPYRNPFVVAKAIATVDALSDGRFVLAAATGYLRSEYRAVGVEFDDRNEIFDEAIEVIQGVWATDGFAYDSPRFVATGQTSNPKPANKVPIWIGGNSLLARRRVARYGDGWNPFPAPATLARTAKTPVLETTDDQARMLGELGGFVADAGRDRSEIDLAFATAAGGSPGDESFDADAQLTALDELAALGVNWNGVSLPGDSLEHALEALERYGELVIAPSAS
jgi:probable F420-dependent oxidoreductase